MHTPLVPELDHLQRAYAVTSKATQQTPLIESAALAKMTGAARVFVKPESLQWAGSFKVRGAYYPWEFQPLQKASERYMRNHMDLNVLEERKRFPRGE